MKNPGASGSLFYLTADDEFIIKTVQKKEAEFLKRLLPGYYMVGIIHQNRPQSFDLLFLEYHAKSTNTFTEILRSLLLSGMMIFFRNECMKTSERERI